MFVLKKCVCMAGVIGLSVLGGVVGSDAEREPGNRFAGLFPEHIRTVALVAPASPADSAAKVDQGIALLKQAGIRVKVMPHAREGEPAGYISISAAKRIADLEQAWLDPEVDLIWAIRGGVGSTEILDRLNWDKLRTRNIPVVGFSNITALHCAMLKENAGHPYAGPSLTQFLEVDPASIAHFRDALASRELPEVPLSILRPGSCSGVALAGHLMLFKAVNHTRFRPDTTSKIVFIECPGQSASTMSQTLKELKDSGFFAQCSGVVFGQLTGCDEAQAEQLMREFANEVDFPVYSGFSYGHTKANHMIDLKRTVAIDEKGNLQFR